MKEEQDFEASVKSGITPDVDFIKENDELVKGFGKDTKNSPAVFLLFLLGAAALFFVNKIAAAVCAVIGAGALFLFLRRRQAIKAGQNTDYLKMIYEEGLLSPGMIVNTQPLTVMAMANIRAQDNCEDKYACYVLRAEHLPGAAGTLYEKIPCSCLFRYEGGNYHSAFQPHPLYWGTRSLEEIRAALYELEREQEENSENEWEMIKKISAEFPDLKPDHMLLLDASYKPIGEKYYLDEEFSPLVTPQLLSQYPKNNPEVTRIPDEIPAAGVYNKMIDLALEHQVYEYIGTHCKDEDFAPLTNPGYFTYIGDKMTFLEALDRRGITLAQGEYPLIAGSMLLTNKGCWKKKEFMPWQDFVLDAAADPDGEIETRVNGKIIVQFKVNTQYYVNKNTFSTEDIKVVKKIELERISRFLQGLKELQ